MEEKTEAVEERRQQLRERLLHNKGYREQYATSALIDSVSLQAAALRRQRGLTQGELAELMGTKQPRVSKIEAPDTDEVPNWEVATLNRMAQAMDCRLKITFETYGSLVEEVGSVTPDTLRRVDVKNDPILNPRPTEAPRPDEDAPERVRWMQERMIPWLWDQQLGLETLVGWLEGYGLPPVGHEETPAQWLLRGIPKDVDARVRDYLERQFAERLAILLGEQPDVYPMAKDQPEEFLIALYSVCAGLQKPEFLAEPTWQAYKRLKESKSSRAVRDALQGALLSNQPEGDRALKEIWLPMVMKGKHRRLSGGEITGFRGMVARRVAGRPDYGPVLQALEVISHRWKGTAADRLEFERMIASVPEADQIKIARDVLHSAKAWSEWAKALLPVVRKVSGVDGSLMISVRLDAREYFAEWQLGQAARTGVRSLEGGVESGVEEWTFGRNRPSEPLLLNALLTHLGSNTQDQSGALVLAHSRLFESILQDKVIKRLVDDGSSRFARVKSALVAAAITENLAA